MKFNTELLHGQAVTHYDQGATLPSLNTASAFGYPNAEGLENVFNQKSPGFVYTRVSNPTVDAFERRVNALEGGFATTATASGMAAISSTFLTLLEQGDEVIASSALFGGTIDLLESLRRFGITTHFVPELTAQAIAAKANSHTRLVFGEIISNPKLSVLDISAVVAAAHERDIAVVLDATTVTPYLVKPLTLGADVVIHSTSKYVNGNGSAISGAIVDAGKFPWIAKHFGALKGFEKYGPYAFYARLRASILPNVGACLAPANAWLNVMGLETMGLRVERICSNALALAKALAATGKVEVNYPALPGSPYEELCRKQFGGHGGGILTLRAGSQARAHKLMDSLQHAVLATNVGDLRTLVLAPATTIFAHASPEQIAAAGVYPDTIRVSVGIEDPEDLIADFEQAIAALAG